MAEIATITVKDPTRTTDLRNRYNAAFRRRIDQVKSALKHLRDVAVFDFPGVINQAFLDIQNPEQGADVLTAQQQQIEAQVFPDDHWQDIFLTAAFLRGVQHSIADGRREGFQFEILSNQQILNDPFLRTPLENIKQRQYQLLKTVLDETNNLTADKLQQVLQAGFTERRTVQQLKRDIFKAMTEVIDSGHTIAGEFHPGLRTRAELIARTEIIKAHAEAQLSYHGSRGTLVGIQIESDACPICVEISPNILTVAEWRSRGGIPFHPQCRCSYVPRVAR